MNRKILVLFTVFTLVLTGCKTDIDPTTLYGMTKEDVIGYIFSHGKKTKNNDVVIGIKASQADAKKYELYTYGDRFFKSKEEALNDVYLKDCNLWQINKGPVFSFSIVQKEKLYSVYFENGKVKKVETIYVVD